MPNQISGDSVDDILSFVPPADPNTPTDERGNAKRLYDAAVYGAHQFSDPLYRMFGVNPAQFGPSPPAPQTDTEQFVAGTTRLLPMLAGGAGAEGMAADFLPSLGSWGRSVVAGAGAGLADTSEHPTEYARNIGLSGAFGPAGKLVGDVGASMLSPFRNLASTTGDFISRMSKEGIQPTLAQLLPENPYVRTVERASSLNPLSAATMDVAAQPKAVNSAVLTRMGGLPEEVGTGTISNDVMSRVDDRLGRTFDAIYKQAPRPLDTEFGLDIYKLKQKNAAAFQAAQSQNPGNAVFKDLESVTPQVNKLPNGQTFVTAPNEPLQDLGATRSTYATLARDAYRNNDSKAGDTYAGVRDAIDRYIQRTYPENAEDIALANKRYAVLKILEKPGVVQWQGSDGTVSPTAFARETQRADKHSYLTDPSELQKFGQDIASLPTKFKSSGTVENASTALLAAGDTAALKSGAVSGFLRGVNENIVKPWALSPLSKALSPVADAVSKIAPMLTPQYLLHNVLSLKNTPTKQQELDDIIERHNFQIGQ